MSQLGASKGCRGQSRGYAVNLGPVPFLIYQACRTLLRYAGTPAHWPSGR